MFPPRFKRPFVRLAASALLCAAVLPLLSLAVNPAPGALSYKSFPDVYFTAFYRDWLAREDSLPYWVPTQDELERAALDARNGISILLNNDVLAYYGKPNVRSMGILGRYSREDLKALLDQAAAVYDQANGERGIRTAFYLIYATCQPKGKIGYLRDETLAEYLDFALENDMLVFIDHQIGRYDPVDSLKEILPFLQYPNVHLALDPEWRTAKPMREIGGITGAELNAAQEAMSRYMAENGIQGERMLVVHQFHPNMITGREEVRANYPGVNLVHCADGFGSPGLKRYSYAGNARAVNMPIKGFKLFYNFKIPGAGYDEPLLSPEEVFALEPRPAVILYQ